MPADPLITLETYAQIHRYAERADGGRSMNESEEALLSDLERVTAERDEARADLTRIADHVAAVLDGQPHTEEDRAWWAACHARVTTESQGTPLEIVAALLWELAEARADVERATR